MNESISNPERSDIDYHRIAAAIEYIESHVEAQPELSEVAEHVHMSPFHFQRMFSHWAGVSPKKFLQYLTLGHARACLLDGKSLLDAAWESGLSGTGRLHDLFVTLEGVTPGIVKTGGAGLTISYGVHDSPFGAMLLAKTQRGLCKLAFVGAGIDSALAELKTEWPQARIYRDESATKGLAESIFTSETPKPIALWIKGSPFQLKVWEALLQIPEGKLASYGDIAMTIGKPAASRAVGTAIGQNPIAYLIPCHRVIRKAGKFGGYRWGATRKKALIGWEAARSTG